MSALILRLRDALEDVTPEWQWTFSRAPGAENKFKFIVRQKETGVERTIYLNENLFHEVSLKTIVQDMVRLLPSKVRAITVDSDNSINVRKHYTSLREDYRDELERMRRQVNRFGNGTPSES
ncbi:MAG: hypothetical protein JWM68_5767 [Verrucomicrobiales bacterium]|nr:hypothetical protein [Verrucomicrobiales bacterium]